MPPTITLEQAKGFSLFSLRAVFSGRGDAVTKMVERVSSLGFAIGTAIAAVLAPKSTTTKRPSKKNT
jgi:hypothetical protein